jgi:hypothetical protein
MNILCPINRRPLTYSRHLYTYNEDRESYLELYEQWFAGIPFQEYSQYSNCFPEKNFQETIKVYPFFNGQKLRTELTVI